MAEEWEQERDEPTEGPEPADGREKKGTRDANVAETTESPEVGKTH